MGRLIPPVAKEKVLQWFPMAEGSDDVVGYAGGTRVGPAWVEDDKWMGGYALDGDGVDDYVETTNGGELGTLRDESFTITATIQTTTTDSIFNRILGWQTDDANERLQVFSQLETNQPGFGIGIDGENYRMKVEEDEAVVNDGRPHRLVYVKEAGTDGDSMSIWLDSIDQPLEEDSSGSTSSTPEPFDTEMIIFGHATSEDPNINFEGIIDDVIIYGDSLTESEIQQDYLRQHWV